MVNTELITISHVLLLRNLHLLTNLIPKITLFFKRLYYLFLERGEGREKEREININVWLPLMHPLLGTWPAAQACALNGNRSSDRLVRRPALSPLSHTSQGSDHLDVLSS